MATGVHYLLFFSVYSIHHVSSHPHKISRCALPRHRYDFDTFGRLPKFICPNGELLTNVYDAGGILQSAEGIKAL